MPRLAGGAVRTRPDAVLADKAYATGVNRDYLRGRGVGAVIPEKRTQVASRKRKGSRGGRSPKFDREKYKGRNVVERAFNLMKQWRGLATRYDKLAVAYRAGVMLAVTHIGDTP